MRDFENRGHEVLLRLLIVITGCLTYSNALHNPFLFDDVGTVVQNAQLAAGSFWDRAFRSSPNTALAGRPLAQLTFAVNYAIDGLNVEGYHALNIGLHVLCALLLFAIVKRTLAWLSRPGPGGIRGEYIACAVALVWVVHPLNSEVVDYVTERTESLMAVFFLLALYCGIRAHASARAAAWQGLAVCSCFAGAACKETIVVAPVLILMYDRAFLFGSFGAALRRRWRFYIGLAGCWIVIFALFLANGQTTSAGFQTAHTSAGEYFLNQPHLLLRYLWLTVWPRALVLVYGWPVHVTARDVWLPLLAITALFSVAIAAVARRSAAGVLVFGAFLLLAPTSSFVPIATEVGAERRMYLPLAALATLAVVGIAALANYGGSKRRSSMIFATLVLLIASPLSMRTIARNREFASPLVMARTVLERWPAPESHYLVGNELAAVGEQQAALTELQQAASGYSPARFQLGSELLRAGRVGEGIAELQQFVHDDPGTLAAQVAHGLLANTFSDQHRYAMAIPEYVAYLRSNSSDADAWNALGVAQMRTEHPNDALESFACAVQGRPGDPRLWMNLGSALLAQGRRAEARTAFGKALLADPSFAPAAGAIRALDGG